MYGNVLEMIGNTSLLEVKNFDTGLCRLFLKMENENPGGSIKDRIGLSMIEAAEKDGSLKPGGILVEGTAGNTGIGLALVAAQKGYRLILVIPDKMSREKIFNLRAMGADVVLTRSDVAKGHPEYYQDLAKTIAEKTEGAVFVNQFGNPANPKAHYETTGPEIWEQMEGKLDAVVLGVGSSGTIAGLTKFFREKDPNVAMVLADPKGSILADYVNTGELKEKNSSWMVEGIGEDFIPVIADLTGVKAAYTITDKESFEAGRELLLREGILGGSSTGTLLAAALKYCQAQTEPKRVVSFVCDTGNKYLSKMYNDYWMRDQGFMERPSHGDLRDLISHPYDEHATVVIGPDEPLNTAYTRMKTYDVSQLPVIEDDNIVGLIDEHDLLLAVCGERRDDFNKPVRSAMISRLEIVDYGASMDTLLPIFEEGLVAIVKDGDRFLGLITRIDLINYLHRKNTQE